MKIGKKFGEKKTKNIKNNKILIKKMNNLALKGEVSIVKKNGKETFV